MVRPAWTHSVRFQLTLWYVGTLAAILLVLAALLLWAVHRALLRQTDRVLATEAAQVVRLLSAPSEPPAPGEAPDPEDLPSPTAVLAQAVPAPKLLPSVTTESLYLRLARADSRRTVALSPNIRADSPLARTLAALPTPRSHSAFVFAGVDEETQVRDLSVVVPQSGYLLQVATPWDPVEDLLARLTAGVGLAIGLFLLLSAVGSWLLVGRSFRPIERLVTEAEAMTADRLAPMRLSPRASDNEIGHLVKALNGMTARLAASFAAQRQFTADASHEMRTPLTILQGEFEVALARERSPGEYRRALESGLEETRRLTRIVDALAFLARGDAEAQRQTLWRTVSLSDLAEEAAQALVLPLREKGLELTMERAGDAVIHGDAEALHRVARNLLDNAIRYTPAGGRITVSTETAGADCRLIVADTGIGIGPDDLPHVFDRFYRADKARVNNGGSGLGLSIAHSVVTAHGGQIEVESRLGEGSRFTVTLPKD